ncbi:MAG: TIGR02300 family protein [Alphaproteobacteria bacterium]|nr:TIGR02300 family protein [Alphaproteobacteria bacterium]MBM3654116.1 TIGR02300 family protein [Alphaproteobacteria bacterium]
MAKPELGAKRQCQSCGTRFFDMNKNPIACPKCGAIYQVVALTRTAARAMQEEESEVEKENPDTVSLEEVEETEAAAESLDVEDEVEIEGDDAEDDTFLEEEEGDDDVSGLIDGDIESDEET